MRLPLSPLQFGDPSGYVGNAVYVKEKAIAFKTHKARVNASSLSKGAQ